MDTPAIAEYYREYNPMKRKELLEKSMAEGEEPEENAIRKQIWEIRYAEASSAAEGGRADGFLALWMTLEFNRSSGPRIFGSRGVQKEVRKHLKKLKFQEMSSESDLHAQLLYRECCHMVGTYIQLCQEDRSYNSTLFGVMRMNKENSKDKLQRDIYETAIALPASIHMEEELGIITRAAREMLKLYYPEDAGRFE
ncbi:MAG: hypothetical protein LUF78_14150 [Clostridiales bacterium]|nr:hypothetical protein [Clostridiales bacterium]MCD8155798.1 hypothetical protein [Clostridiales bacterium]